MKIGEYKSMMKWLTRPGTPKEIEKKIIQNVKTTPIKFDPTPIVPMPTEIYDPLAKEQQRFNNLLKEVEAEKTRNKTQGLAGLLGGVKDA